ncbi:MAG: hypothetical protein JJU29_21000 [Verrucomicrobia bacterium]|nr:hypothetical protein [Verrucomicrobiota bacterium]MCH8513740.1 hypothetical protein [Kiritimatiellia bacterium]
MYRLFLSFVLLNLMLAPLCAQPVEVFTPNPAAEISAEMPFTPAAEPALWLVAPRNGSATAPVVLRAARGLDRIRPQLSPLRTASGQTLPADALRIRFGTQGLLDRPEADGAFLAVWLTADIPAQTPAGDYRGALRIPGAPDIPVRVQVADWIAPNPNAFQIRASLLQSAETVARHYDVPVWSEDHFRHLDSTLRLMGQIGSQVMYLNLAGHTHFGNEHTHLRWSGAERAPEPEFTALEQYFVLWNRHLGPPRQIILYMMEDAWATRPPQTMQVSYVPSPRGATQTREIPFYWRGDTEAWRRAIDGIRERVRQIGWTETEVLFGVIHDNRNWPPEKLEFFEAVGPGLRWAAFTHGRGDPPVPSEGDYRIGPLSFGYIEYPYATRSLIDPSSQNGHWTRAFPFITSMRDSSLMGSDSLPAYWRLMPMASALNSRGAHHYTGFGRIGFDFWDVDGRPLIGQFFRNHNLYRGNPRFVVRPGLEGAVATPMFEHFREGVLSAEALAVVMNRLHGEDPSPPTGQRKTLEEAATQAFDWIQSYYFLEAREGGNDPLRQAFLKMAEAEWRPALFALYEAAGIAAGAQTAPPESPGADPAFRTWTSRDGRQIQARMLRADRTSVELLRADGRTFTAPLESLSDADQQYLRNPPSSTP